MNENNTIDLCKLSKCDKQERINNLQSKIDKAIEYIEKNTHNIYANGYRDRETGELLSKEKTPIINRIFSQNPKDLLDILKKEADK